MTAAGAGVRGKERTMKKKLFDRAAEWRSAVPVPVLEVAPEPVELYWKAWALAHDHVKELPGMPQTLYMDEAFCANLRSGSGIHVSCSCSVRE